MRLSPWPGALALALFLSLPILAADLTKIERKILKEPAYTSAPKYCLLVFGPEAKSRIWLVLDGDTLYVDRNGNGDLTEPGEKVARETKDVTEGDLYFKVGDITEEGRTHKELYVYLRDLGYLAEHYPIYKDFLAKNPKAKGYSLGLDVDMPGWKGDGLGGRVTQSVTLRDYNGFLQFAGKPEEAPVLHFGGPWQLTLSEQTELTIGRESDLTLNLGTPGLGTGTTVRTGYEEVVPEKVYPKVEITYPAKQPGEAPVKERYELNQRC